MPDVALSLLLQSALLPFALSVAGLALARKWPGAATSAIALAVAFLAAYFVMYRWSPAPYQTLDWLPYLTIAALCAAEFARRRACAVRTLVRVVLIMTALVLLLKPVLWQAQHAAPLALAGGAWLALTWAADQNSARLAGGWVLLVVAAGLAGVLALESSLLLGQLGGALASALFGWVAWNIPSQRVALGTSAAWVIAMLLGTLTLIAYVYAALPLARIAWLAAACAVLPLAAWLEKARAGINPFALAVASALIAAMPVGVALWQAWQAAQEAGGY
ncbi:MAG: hypothetical protein AB1513_06260 [Pseudomonadota bacterium]